MAECISANGKSNILNTLSRQRATRVLVIADAAAFGSEIRDLVQFIQSSDRKIDLFLPESLEWLILKSAIFNNSTNVQGILRDPADYIECQDYFSWERFFTYLLVLESKDRPNLSYPNNKHTLPAGYLSESNMDSIIKSMT